jgi:hypothetical protein
MEGTIMPVRIKVFDKKDMSDITAKFKSDPTSVTFLKDEYPSVFRFTAEWVYHNLLFSGTKVGYFFNSFAMFSDKWVVMIEEFDSQPKTEPEPKKPVDYSALLRY